MFGNRRIYDNHSQSHFPNQTHTHINKNNYTIDSTFRGALLNPYYYNTCLIV